MNPILKNLKLVFTNSTEETLAATAWQNVQMFYMFQTRRTTDVQVEQFEDHAPLFSLDWDFLNWVAPFMESLGYRQTLSNACQFVRI